MRPGLLKGGLHSRKYGTLRTRVSHPQQFIRMKGKIWNGALLKKQQIQVITSPVATDSLKHLLIPYWIAVWDKTEPL